MSTLKIIESAHVRIDEFAERSEEESSKEPKDYKRFFFYEPNTYPIISKGNDASTPKSPKAPTFIEL